MSGKFPSSHSRANGAKATPNYYPNTDFLNSTLRIGRRRADYREFMEYAHMTGATENPTDTPSLVELRLVANSQIVPIENRRKGPAPFTPPLPDAYSLPDLVDTQSCLGALAQITRDTVSGKLHMLTAAELREHVETLWRAYEPSEIRARLVLLCHKLLR
jgi:hypothetical protein